MYKNLILTKLVRAAKRCSNLKTISDFLQNFRCSSPQTLDNITDLVPHDVHSRFNEYIKNFSISKRNFSTTSCLRNGHSQMGYNEQRRKVIPKLTYFHNPWKYFIMKCNLWKLQWFWDREFVEEEFIRGSKQAAIVLTDIIRTQNTKAVRKFTTPLGFQQITRDMLLSRKDPRLKLLKFETEHLRHAIPAKIATQNISETRKYCFIDMLFVCLRNTKDFETLEEVNEVKEVLRQLDADRATPIDLINVPHRIVFAEILIRFRRNYSDKPGSDKNDWAVSFYNILTFDVLNDPRT